VEILPQSQWSQIGLIGAGLKSICSGLDPPIDRLASV